jgi:sporulation protein YlmC with PRC-barrel domain
VELTAEPQAFSDLVGLPVSDQAGRSLGRVFEARAHWDRDGSLVLDELMIGRRALLRRLRGPRPDARGIPWESVVEIGRDRIVVHRRAL